MSPLQFHRRVLAAVKAMRVLPARATLVVGVSGGADSMALLACLTALSERRDTGWRLHAAHLNHRIRGRAAQRDAEFVRRLARRWTLPVHVDSLDVPAHARRFGLSLEEAARDCRYRFLRSVAESVGAAAVAVGHHADDQAETVLHRLVRGTGWRGLAGMPACRALAPDSPVMLIRPLLELHRAEIRAYLKARRLRFRDDRSNARLRHARNRIRERLMPLLARDFNPRAADALLRLAAQARQLSDLIERLADQAEISIHRRNGAALPPAVSAPPPVSASGAVRFSYAAFAALPEIVRAEVIRRAVERLGAGLREIGHERLGAAVRTLSGGRGGRRVQLPGGITVVRRGREVIVCAQGE